jgi:tetratricopeptide (TPR) repeat protein
VVPPLGVIAILALSITAPAPSPDAVIRRAIERARANDLDRAVEDFTLVLSLRPRDITALLGRGDARERKHDHAGAIADFTEALRLAPGNAWVYLSRGIARRWAEDVQGSLADYTEAIRLQPTLAAAFGYRAIERRDDANDGAGAREDFLALARLLSSDPRAAAWRGFAEQAGGDLRAALAEFDESIRRNPRTPCVFVDRARARQEAGDCDGAVADYTEVLRLDPNYADVPSARARARALAGDRATAIAELEQIAAGAQDDLSSGLWIAALGGCTDGAEALAGRADWNGHLALLTLDRLAREDLIAEARSAADGRDRRQRLCEATGLAGLIADREGDVELAGCLYSQCVETRVAASIWPEWARARLAQMRWAAGRVARRGQW